MRVLTRAVAVLACLLIIPAVAYAQASLTGTAKDTSGAVLPGVTVEAASVLDRKSPHGGHRRQRPVPDRRPAPGRLRRDVHADGVQHLQARRHRAQWLRHGRRSTPSCASESLEETMTVTGETPDRRRADGDAAAGPDAEPSMRCRARATTSRWRA